MSSLQKIAYNKFASQYGTHSYDIIVGEKYRLLDMDGINWISLGTCLINDYTPPSYMNDGVDILRLRFEFNNNHNIFGHRSRILNNNEYSLIFCGDGNRKLNIYQEC